MNFYHPVKQEDCYPAHQQEFCSQVKQEMSYPVKQDNCYPVKQEVYNPVKKECGSDSTWNLTYQQDIRTEDPAPQFIKQETPAPRFVKQEIEEEYFTQLTKDWLRWTSKEVATFLSAWDSTLEKYSERFVKEGIDGRALMLVDMGVLRRGLKLTSEASRKVLHFRDVLLTRSR